MSRARLIDTAAPCRHTNEYIREGRPRYELFAKTVAAILQAAIEAGPQEFRLQQITCRAKDLVSLKRKLTDRELLDSNSIEEELKDLAGCRLIFYTNTDVDRFLNSRLIFENLVVDFDGSKSASRRWYGVRSHCPGASV